MCSRIVSAQSPVRCVSKSHTGVAGTLCDTRSPTRQTLARESLAGILSGAARVWHPSRLRQHGLRMCYATNVTHIGPTGQSPPASLDTWSRNTSINFPILNDQSSSSPGTRNFLIAIPWRVSLTSNGRRQHQQQSRRSRIKRRSLNRAAKRGSPTAPAEVNLLRIEGFQPSSGGGGSTHTERVAEPCY